MSKATTLGVLGGLGGLAALLLPAASGAADYLGVESSVEFADSCDWEAGRGDIIAVIRFHAIYDDPNDQLVAVAGTPGSPLSIQIEESGGFQPVFFQHPFGSDLPPNSAWFEVFPSVEYDTFVSIGALADDTSTGLTPGWPGFGPFSLAGDSLAWFIPPDDPQGHPDEAGRVFFGQFSVRATDGGHLPGWYGASIQGHAFLQSFLADGKVF
ncbi:MAG: hypothetical protein ACYTGG_11140, partial [Planctomycetota bacterium]